MIFGAPQNKSLSLFPLYPHLFAVPEQGYKQCADRPAGQECSLGGGRESVITVGSVLLMQSVLEAQRERNDHSEKAWKRAVVYSLDCFSEIFLYCYLIFFLLLYSYSIGIMLLDYNLVSRGGGRKQEPVYVSDLRKQLTICVFLPLLQYSRV